jgi:carboxyl-terminal processing protease
VKFWLRPSRFLRDRFLGVPRMVLPTVGAFVGGLAVGAFGNYRAEATPETQNPYQAISQLGRVLVQVENTYVDPVERTKLVEGAIKGMVNNLDPHSSYMPPDEWKQFQSDTEGKFGGVGLEVDGRGERLVVIAPIEGSPAARAGIQSGDQIMAIDGVEVLAETLDRVVKKMRGVPGTKVKVTIHRESGRGTSVAGAPDSGIVPLNASDAGAAREPAARAERTGQTLTFELVREIIHVSSVSYKLLAGNAAYLRIKQFQEKTHDEMMLAAAALREHAKGGRVAGVLLDLRSNPGGLVDEATSVADEFLSHGGIYSMRHRGEAIENITASPGGAFVDVPVVALVNEWSASASELVVGALQDNGRAQVVGAATFGKGSVQSIFPLPNGSGLKLTTARYYTPSGRAIQADGIHPDVVVESRARDSSELPHVMRERDLPGHLSPEEPGGRVPHEHAKAVVVDAGTDLDDVAMFARQVPADPSLSPDAVLRIGYQLLRTQMQNAATARGKSEERGARSK